LAFSNASLMILMYPSNAICAIITVLTRNRVCSRQASQILSYVSVLAFLWTMTTISNCDNCGIPIRWQPTIVDGGTYCCLGCAVGGPCTCDYSRLPHVGESRAIVCRAFVIMLSAPQRDRHGLTSDTDHDLVHPRTNRDAEGGSAGPMGLP